MESQFEALMMKDLYRLKREFLEYCEIEKGQSILTIENYDRYLTRFLTWLENEIKIQETRNKNQTNPNNQISNDQNGCHPRPDRGSTIVDSRLHGNDKHGSPLETSNYKLKASQIDQETIRKYRLYVNRLSSSDGRELKASTQNHHILALRAFLRYLSFTGEKTLSPEKLTLAKTGDREVSFLNKEEYERLLSVPDVATINGMRDKALLELLFSTGLRVSELCGLRLGQLNFEKGEIAVLGKGKKLRVVFISESALKYLSEYLTKRGVLKSQIINRKSQTNSKSEITNDQNGCHPRLDRGSNIVADQLSVDSRLHGNDRQGSGNDKMGNGEIPDTQYVILDMNKDDPVFLSNRKNPIKPRAVERLVQKYSKLAGISKKVTPHTLRHTFATDLLGAGADIRSVQSLLGHANISTTQVYTHVTDKHLREIHARYHDKGRNDEDTTTDHIHRSTQINPKETDGDRTL